MITDESACTTAYPLEVIAGIEAFDALRDDWRDLERRDSRCRVFQTHTWLRHVYELEHTGRVKLELAVLRDAAGRMVAAAPMVSERRMGLLGVRVLRFLGRGFSDYQDILMADDCDANKVLAQLAAWLQKMMMELDRVELLKLPDGSHLWEHRDRLIPGATHGLSAKAQTYDQTRYVVLEGTFEDYLYTLSKPTRKNFRRYSRYLEQDHAVRWDVVTSSQGSEPLLSDLVRLHQQRQNECGQRGMFRTAVRVDVFTRLFKVMLDEGAMRLHVLYVDGKVYNIDLVFRHGDTATVYNGGMDNIPEVARNSPGFLSICRAIEHAYNDPGLKLVDLGQGDEDYKAHIAKQTRVLHRLRWSRPNLRCRLDDWFHGTKAWAQQHPVVQKVYAGVKG